MRKLPVALAAALFLLLTAAPAFAHASLVSSVPVGGSTVAKVPSEIVLEFNERIEADFGGVQLFDASGTRVPSGEPQIAGSTVKMPLEELPGAGDYTVVFRIISGDGHPVESRFAFSYRPPEPSPEPSPSPSIIPPGPPPSGPQPVDVQLQGAPATSSFGLWLARLLNYLTATLTVGFLLAGLYLFDGGSAARKEALATAGKMAVMWAVSTLFLFAFGLSVAAALPVSESLGHGLPGRFAGTRFGEAVTIQGAALLLAGLIMLAGKGRRKAGLLGAVLGALALLAPGAWGHAGTAKLTAIAMLSDWAHLAAVTAWVGGLAVLALAVLAPGSPIEPLEPSKRFSRLAGLALFVVLVSGSINAVMRIHSFGELFSTGWGRLVLVKYTLFGLIVLIGYRNRKKMLPGMERDPVSGKAAFRRMALLEVCLMIGSFVAATALASSIPSDAEAAARIQTLVTPFGEGQINLTVDPAAVGENIMHLYFLDAGGRPLEVTDASVTMAIPGTTIEPRLFESGPGHYTVLAQELTRPGSYNVIVEASLDGQKTAATGTITIR